MKEKKNLNWDLVILGCVGIMVVAFLCCGLASCNLLSGNVGKCLAISPFGKLELLGVDKAVVTVDGEAVTVTDPALLERIVDETKVASLSYTCTGCNMKDRTIDLYRGDQLVRSMEWYDCQDGVRVYDTGLTHWIFPEPGAGMAKAGYVELSRELVNELNALF